MTSVTCVMKSGETYCGPLWAWRPKEGWFSLVLDMPESPDQIWLRDVASAINRGERIGVLQPGVARLADVDLLVRAREEGWSGL